MVRKEDLNVLECPLPAKAVLSEVANDLREYFPVSLVGFSAVVNE